MVKVNRRDLMVGAGAASVAGLTLSTANASEAKPAPRRDRRPNILMIVTDQETGLASMPEGVIERLPGHLALLKRGTSFANYHVHTTPCSPSRSNIYTGQHTQKTGIWENTNTTESTTLSTDIPTIGTMLRKAGYYTAYKGKWHLSSINGVRDWNQEVRRKYPSTENAMEEYGFSDYGFDGESVGLTWAGYIDDRGVAGDACKLIDDFAKTDKAGGKPWFMAVNFVNPHDIMFFDATGKQSDSRRAPDFISPLKSEPGDPLYAENLGLPLPKSFYLDDLSTKPEIQTAIQAQNVLTYGEMPHGDERAWLRFVNYYYNCLRDVDRSVEQVLWALKASGQLDNTIIVYTADHGERAGAHGMRQKGGTVYREETNVPMIMVHPDLRGGNETRALMSAVDIVPTLLSFAGADAGWQNTHYPDLVGVDVSEAVARPATRTQRDARGHLFNLGVVYTWQRAPEGKGNAQGYDLRPRRLHRGVFDGQYKFARYFSPAQHHIPKTWDELVGKNDLELYDTVSDPLELVNLAYEPSNVTGEGRQTIMRLSAMVNALIATEVGPDIGQEYPGPIEQYTSG
jgi:arylsulfatase